MGDRKPGGIVVRIAIVAVASLGILASACDSAKKDEGPEPFASRYQPLESETTLLRGATVLTGTGHRVAVHVIDRPGDVAGINDRLDLSAVEGELRRRTNRAWSDPAFFSFRMH